MLFLDDIRENGIHTPLDITSDGRVVDGETRRMAARALQIAEVPCRLVPEEQAHEIIVRQCALRRNLTLGQRVYLLLPCFEEMLAAGKRRRLENLRKGQQIPESAFAALSGNAPAGIEEIAARIGASRRLVCEAIRLRELFAADPELREQFEPKILDLHEPISIGRALAGVGGKVSTDRDYRTRKFGDETGIKRDPIRLLETSLNSISRQLDGVIESPESLADFRRRLRERFLGYRKWDAAECARAAERHRFLSAEFARLAKHAGRTEDIA